VSTADLIQSEYDQKHLNCWTLDHWMSGGPVAGVTPLARLANLPRPPDVVSLEAAVSSSLSLSHTSSEIWLGDKNLCFFETLMAADTEQVASHDLRVQPANRLFFLRRSYSFGLHFNPAV
jgi:hypothetical protein